ncbi:SGNH/GDSL hydrolase family protein [soil metagenome]
MSRLPAVLLAPIVLVQGRRLRETIPRMQPAMPRAGGSSAAGALRLLVLGDSSAVGTGVDQMADAVAGQVAKRISEPVAWRVVGANGLTSGEVLEQQLAEALSAPADLIVLLVGWNDALQMRSARAFGDDLAGLLDALYAHNPTARFVVVATPRFGDFAVYPQPLRAVLGAQVAGLTRAAESVAAEHGALLVPGFDGVHVSTDRFHPDATGYAAIADSIITALAR